MSGTGQNIISLGFDIEKLTAEKKEVLDLFVDLFGKLQAYDGTKFNPLGGGGLADLKKSVADNAKAIADLQAGYVKYNETITANAQKQAEAKKATDDTAAAGKTAASVVYAQTASFDNLTRKAAENQRALKDNAQAQKDLEKAYQSGEVSLDQYNSQSAKLIGQQNSIKVANAEVTRSLSLMEKQTQAATGSQQQLEVILFNLKADYAALSGAQRDSQSGNIMLKEIQELDAQVKNINYSVGQFQRNVGNYSGSFVKAFEVLKEQLAATKTQMTDLTGAGTQAVNKFGFDPNRYKDVSSKTGASVGTSFVATENLPQFDSLSSKAQVLESNIERLSVGFKTTRQESRAFAEAASQVGLALGLESEEFQVFDQAVGQSQKAINDIKEATKFQASDAKLITGLANAASTLAGGFGAAQAAVSLFRGEDEDLQKQMAKFQQLLVLINGLQAVANGLQAESGGVQLLLSVKTGLLNAAKATQLLITTRAVQIIASETAATTVNVGAKEAEVVATTQLSVAEGAATGAAIENTEATVANAAAQEGAAAATSGLSTAFIAGGIAVLAIGAGVALALLTAKLIGFGQQTGLTIKQQEEMANAMKEANQVVIDQTEFIKNLDSATLKYYQNQLSLSKSSGENKYRQYAIEKQIAEQERISVQQTIDALGANNKQQGALAGTIQLLNDKKSEAIRIEKDLLAIPTKDLTGSQKDQLTAAQANVEFYQKQIDGVKGLYDAGEKARNDLQAANQKDANLDVDLQKFTADEERKVTLETTKLQIEAIKDKNSRTLSDDRSTLQQRLAAIRSNAEQEKREAQANFNALDPKATVRETEIAQAQLSAARKKADNEAAVQSFEITRTYNDRLLEAQAAVNRNLLESDVALQAAISSDQQQELEARLDALKKGIDDKTKIIVDDYNRKLKLAKEHGKTLEEQDQIASNRDTALVALTADTQKQIYDITLSYGEKRLKDIEDLNKTGTAANDAQAYYNEQVDLLNQGLLRQKISYTQYLTDKRLLDERYRIDKDKADIKDDEVVLQRIKDLKDKEFQVELDGAKNVLDAAKGEGNDEDIANAQKKVDALTAVQTKANADDVVATTKREKDKQQLRKDQVDPTLSALKTLKEKEAQVEQASFDFAKTLVDSSYENRINQIQATIDKTDEQANAEVAAIQRSTLSQRDQTAEIIIIQAQQHAKDTQLKNEEKKEKISEAKFDRDMAVAKTIWDTEQAVMAIWAGNGAVPPYAAATTAAVIALGAISVATILAKPIPTYGDGIENHPGGLAWVGERFEPEEVNIPGRDPFIVNTPTLLDMPGGSSVTPLDMHNIINDIGWGAIARGAAIVNAVVMDSGSDQIVGALEKHGARMERAFKKSQRKIINRIEVHVDADWQNYLNKKVYGKG